MRKFQYQNAHWYVGIAADPRDRLFNEHNVDEENGIWIYEKATSDAVGRSVEEVYLDTGHDGGGGGGDKSSVYVYSYAVNPSKKEAKMSIKEHHVVPGGDKGGWDIKKGGGRRAIKHFGRKQDAVDYAREISKNQDSELIVHKKDSTIQNPDSHGGDPCPPKDKK
jgi:Uncharacterized protein conserved in bacteria (DUF2188)